MASPYFEILTALKCLNPLTLNTSKYLIKFQGNTNYANGANLPGFVRVFEAILEYGSI